MFCLQPYTFNFPFLTILFTMLSLMFFFVFLHCYQAALFSPVLISDLFVQLVSCLFLHIIFSLLFIFFFWHFLCSVLWVYRLILYCSIFVWSALYSPSLEDPALIFCSLVPAQLCTYVFLFYTPLCTVFSDVFSFVHTRCLKSLRIAVSLFSLPPAYV